MTHRDHTGGFTLIELSVVLAILAVVTGMAVSSGVSVVSTARLVATQQKMKAIDDALMAYRAANDRLPCPGDLTLPTTNTNYGIEAANPGTCTGGTPAANNTASGITNTVSTAAEGALPALTLGLPADYMVDGWGNRFRYAVDTSMTSTDAFQTLGISCSLGALTINDANGNARSTASIYALISHGANGHGAYTSNGVVVNAGSVNTNEQTNCHCNNSAAATTYSPAYVQMQPTLDSTNSLDIFDDLVSFKERWQLQTPWDKAGSCASQVYVADLSNDRIEIFNLGGAYVGQFGTSGTANGQFNVPYSVAVDSNSHLYVADYNNHRVQELTASGTFIKGFGAGYNGVAGAIGSYGTANGQLYFPYGVAIDVNNNLWVGDSYNNRVVEYNTSSGAFMMGIGAGYNGVAGAIGSTGTAPGQINKAAFVTFDPSGNVWVGDYTNCRVQQFNSSTGAFQMAVGAGYNGVAGPVGNCGGANKNGKMSEPDGLLVYNNILYVVDHANGNIHTYNATTGAYLGDLSSEGSGNGQLDGPDGITLDSFGNLWVGDRLNNRIEKFSLTGSYEGQFGSLGSGAGQFNNPFGVSFAITYGSR